MVTHYAQAERLALCETFRGVGPDAPTLCDPWRTRQLAAHLVIRESRPDLAAGMFVSPLTGRLDRALQERAEQDWDTLVAQVQSGPPIWHPTRFAPVHEFVNGLEFFVHHEDVLRAAAGWQPRPLPIAHERALWTRLRAMAGLLLRRCPVGVILVADGVGREQVRQTTHHGVVVVRANVAELVMFVFGRTQLADIRFRGPDEAVAALRGAQLSFP